MATDATGTPTSLGIPKFDVTNDAPSGLGGNAQMDSIDALLVQTPRSGSIAGIAVGSVPVWNGTAWVKPSGTPDGTKYLRDDGAWVAVGAWAAYTPAWTSSGTAPAIGNGSLTGRYAQVGKVVHAVGRAVFGSTTTFGTGSYFFSLPVTASTLIVVGAGHIEDAGVATYEAHTRWASTTTLNLFTTASPSALVGAAVPFTFGTNDAIEFSLVYEAA